MGEGRPLIEEAMKLNIFKKEKLINDGAERDLGVHKTPKTTIIVSHAVKKANKLIFIVRWLEKNGN